MSRKNSNRMGPPVKPAQQPTANPLLNFVKPTLFVDLPSKGRGYSEGHPLKGQEVIEVFQMTARDEDILTSESLIKKGIVIDRFVENILVDKTVSVDSLLIGDKNAILIDSRIMGYGADYNTEIVCPSCFTKQSVSYDLNDKSVYHGESHEVNENGNYHVKLPQSGITLEIQQLTSKEEGLIVKRMTERKKKKTDETTVTDQYKLMVVSANGVTDKGQVNQFIDLMPLRDSLTLKKFYKEISPNVELKFDFTCKSCEYNQELEVPLGAEFFWPRQ